MENKDLFSDTDFEKLEHDDGVVSSTNPSEMAEDDQYGTRNPATSNDLLGDFDSDMIPSQPGPPPTEPFMSFGGSEAQAAPESTGPEPSAPPESFEYVEPSKPAVEVPEPVPQAEEGEGLMGLPGMATVGAWLKNVDPRAHGMQEIVTEVDSDTGSSCEEDSLDRSSSSSSSSSSNEDNDDDQDDIRTDSEASNVGSSGSDREEALSDAENDMDDIDGAESQDITVIENPDAFLGNAEADMTNTQQDFGFDTGESILEHGDNPYDIFEPDPLDTENGLELTEESYPLESTPPFGYDNTAGSEDPLTRFLCTEGIYDNEEETSTDSVVNQGMGLDESGNVEMQEADATDVLPVDPEEGPTETDQDITMDTERTLEADRTMEHDSTLQIVEGGEEEEEISSVDSQSPNVSDHEGSSGESDSSGDSSSDGSESSSEEGEVELVTADQVQLPDSAWDVSPLAFSKHEVVGLKTVIEEEESVCVPSEDITQYGHAEQQDHDKLIVEGETLSSEPVVSGGNLGVNLLDEEVCVGTESAQHVSEELQDLETTEVDQSLELETSPTQTVCPPQALTGYSYDEAATTSEDSMALADNNELVHDVGGNDHESDELSDIEGSLVIDKEDESVEANAEDEASTEETTGQVPVTEIPVEAPVMEVPVETPVMDIPVETPVMEIPVETPVMEIPVEAPVMEIPVEAPVMEIPIETPVMEIPVETPVIEIPVETPVMEIPDEAPVIEIPVETPIMEIPVEAAPAEELPVEEPLAEVPAEEIPVETPLIRVPVETAAAVEVPVEAAPVMELTVEEPLAEVPAEEIPAEEIPGVEVLNKEQEQVEEAPTEAPVEEQVSDGGMPVDATIVEDMPVEGVPVEVEEPVERVVEDEAIVKDEVPVSHSGAKLQLHDGNLFEADLEDVADEAVRVEDTLLVAKSEPTIHAAVVPTAFEEREEEVYDDEAKDLEVEKETFIEEKPSDFVQRPHVIEYVEVGNSGAVVEIIPDESSDVMYIECVNEIFEGDGDEYIVKEDVIKGGLQSDQEQCDDGGSVELVEGRVETGEEDPIRETPLPTAPYQEVVGETPLPAAPYQEEVEETPLPAAPYQEEVEETPLPAAPYQEVVDKSPPPVASEQEELKDRDILEELKEDVKELKEDVEQLEQDLSSSVSGKAAFDGDGDGSVASDDVLAEVVSSELDQDEIEEVVGSKTELETELILPVVKMKSDVFKDTGTIQVKEDNEAVLSKMASDIVQSALESVVGSPQKSANVGLEITEESTAGDKSAVTDFSTPQSATEEPGHEEKKERKAQPEAGRGLRTGPARMVSRPLSSCPPTLLLLWALSQVVELIYWKDVKKTGVVFGTMMFVLISLACFTLLSVLAYLSLAVLTVTFTFRVYKNIMQAVQKSGDGHPFKNLLDMQIELREDVVQNAAENIARHLNNCTRELRRLYLVQDYIDSLKFGLLLWVLTYIGSWFNGMTLIMLAVVSIFTLPKVYDTYKVQIDTYINMGRAQLNKIMAQITSKIPFPKKKAKTQ